MEIKLASYARTLGPRVLGQEILQQALKHIRTENEMNVVFDFEGLEGISSGFSYELFGGLQRELGSEFKNRVKIRFAANPKEANDKASHLSGYPSSRRAEASIWIN